MAEKHVLFSITVETEEGLVYYQQMPPMPMPHVGDDLFASGSNGDGAMGWWTVEKVRWGFPQMDAHTPTMAVNIRVRWSEANNRPAPVYDELLGFVDNVE